MHLLLTILLGVALLVVGGWAVASSLQQRRLVGQLKIEKEQREQAARQSSRIERRRTELEAVLASMVEGVAAIDNEEKVISLNPAAAEMFSLDPEHAVGRPIQEVVRNTVLQSLVTETIDSSTATPTTCELTLRLNPESSTEDRTIQAQAAPVLDPSGRHVGAVVVLHDITRLRRLESVRRDFVANVSHEIKTPISAIKAAVETLIDDEKMPAGPRKNFTGIIARQTDRLDAIIEDLLSLTRLEQEGTNHAKDLEAHAVGPAIRAACESCHAKAQAKSIDFEITLADAAVAHVVPTLLEQALVNLIDNAVKYSPEGTAVRITAQTRGQRVVISVIDQGRGIEAEHLPRIFERFYRTDRARSRQLGGTGLGLSIVKHIAETLGGRASVHSALGRGSTFALTLQAGPANSRPAASAQPVSHASSEA